jgi:hypothetical protein
MRLLSTLLLLPLLGLAGCGALDTPYLDAHFGQSSEQARTTQAVPANRATSGNQMNAQALHNGMVNYMGDRPAPQAIQGVLGGTGGGVSGQ